MSYVQPHSNPRWISGAMWCQLGFVMAVVGQVLLQGRDYWPLGVGLYLVASSLFLFGTRGERLPANPPESARPALIGAKRLRRLLAGLALLLGGVTFAASGGNRLGWSAVLAWGGGCVVWILAFVERPRWILVLERWRNMEGVSVHLGWRHLALLLVLLVAAWFRFHRLAGLPGEMTIDHPYKLLDIRDLLQGQYRVFFPRNTGRELAQFYYTAALVRLLGLPLGFDTLKIGAALVSLFAVGVTYALAAELFGWQTGLFTAVCLAVARWDLGISRIGLRYPFASLPLAGAALFLFRTLHRGRRSDALWCGLSIGLGLHGYSSFRVVPVLVAVAFMLKAALDRDGVRAVGVKRYWSNAALSLVLAILVVMPLGRYMLDNPRMFWYRVLTRASDLERTLPSSPAQVFLSNAVNSLLAFNWRGDIGWVHLVQRIPFLDPISGALLVLGISAALWRVVRYRDWRSACLLLGLPILLLPSSLSLAFPIENPSANRSSVAIPLVFTLVGLPFSLLLRASWNTTNRVARLAAVICLCLSVSLIGYLNYGSYFKEYAAQFSAHAWNASEFARVIRGFSDSCGSVDQAYIAPWPHYIDGRAVAFELGDWGWYNLMNDLSELEEQAVSPGNKLYLVHLGDQASLNQLRETYPHAQVRPFRSATPGHGFWIVLAPDMAS